MVITKESHREALLQLIEQATFPGSAVDAVYELKQEIIAAKCFEPTKGEGENANIRDR